jgi:hypothetical protein
MPGFACTAAPDADVTEVANAIVKVVDLPFGKRPSRVRVDPAHDGAEVVNGVADRVRAELLHNMGRGDLLGPSSTSAKGAQEPSRFRRIGTVDVAIHVPEVVAEQASRIGGEGCAGLWVDACGHSFSGRMAAMTIMHEPYAE